MGVCAKRTPSMKSENSGDLCRTRRLDNRASDGLRGAENRRNQMKSACHSRVGVNSQRDPRGPSVNRREFSFTIDTLCHELERRVINFSPGSNNDLGVKQTVYLEGAARLSWLPTQYYTRPQEQSKRSLIGKKNKIRPSLVNNFTRPCGHVWSISTSY
jgi:hypothetical protein